MSFDDVRDLEEMLDAGPNAPPSPPRGSSADLLAHQRSTLAGWSPRITAEETSAGDLPPSLSLGAASLAIGTNATNSGPVTSSSSGSVPFITPSASTAPPPPSIKASVTPPQSINTTKSTKSTTSTTSTSISDNTTPTMTAKDKKAAEKKARAAAYAAANPNKGKKEKKPKLSKAERRAKQESQRAAKEGKTGTNKKDSKSPSNRRPSISKTSESKKETSSDSNDPGNASQMNSRSTSKASDLFSHLPLYQRSTIPKRSGRFSSRDNVHPSFARIGLMMTKGEIVGGNNRCVALLEACKDVITDYQPPPNSSLPRTLNGHLKPMIAYLVQCRPMSISMGNAINFVKRLISGTRDMTDEETREHLLTSIDDFMDKRIKMADELIMRNLLGLEPHTTAKIVNGDVVLTHARSHVVEEALKYAYSIGIQFRVVIVDSRPMMEGRELLKALAEHGIQCTYCMLPAVAYVMKDVTKVILGASAMMSNGTALSRTGTAVVAMMGHSQRIPIIFCCETYKFCERVQLDAIVSNEVADPNDLVVRNADPSKVLLGGTVRKVASNKDLQGHEEFKSLSLLNISYDLTPQEFITVVVTDVGMIPTTSVPVIIKEFLNEAAFQ